MVTEISLWNRGGKDARPRKSRAVQGADAPVRALSCPCGPTGSAALAWEDDPELK